MFHEKLLKGRVLIVGCPKLDDGNEYLDKLTAILKTNNIKSVTIAYMEVPCCSGLLRLADMALQASGKNIPAARYKIMINGEIIET